MIRNKGSIRLSKHRSTLCHATIVILTLGGLAFSGCTSKPQPESGTATTKTEAPPAPPQSKTLSQLGTGACHVSELVGFNDMENWGAWSRQDPSTIRLGQPVSGPLDLNLTAYSLNDHTSHAVKVTIGSETRTVTLTPNVPHSFQLQYKIANPASEIVLSGIRPVSPKDLRTGSDDRKLAVGLLSVECIQAQKASTP